MNNQLTKFGLVVLMVFLAAYIVLKPIVYSEEEYKVVIVNISEHNIDRAEIMGVGRTSGDIGPILVGKINDFIFTPDQDGTIKYSIMQNNRELTGVINNKLKKGDVGEVFVVVGEMYKVSIRSDFDMWLMN